MEEEFKFTPRYIGIKSCDDSTLMGRKSIRYDYILKATTGDAVYPYIPENYVGICTPFVHGSAQIDDIQVNVTITGSPTCTLGDVSAEDCTLGDVDCGAIDCGAINASTVTATQVTAGGVTLTSRKSFDIPHPVKSGYRLRHVCLEGPESAVYYRGRLSNSNIINLPDYWVGLVGPESITVTLTQINSSQDLIVEKIDSGKTIKIRSGSSSTIDCYFLVYGERIDGEKLIVEYEGNQYPGDDSQYSLNK